MSKPDAMELSQRNAALEAACATLHETLLSLGEAIPRGMIPGAPRLLGGDVLSYHRALLQYHSELVGLISGKHKTATAAATPAKADVAPAPVVSAVPSVVTAPAVSVSAELSKDEIAALTWTEKVQFSGGKITAKQARERIAARANAKTLTEKVLAAKGCKTLSELPHANDPLD